MRIERLVAQNFRNLEAIDILPTAPTVVLQGDNAQGKTNLLEALHLAATGRSFRGANAATLIGEGQTHGRCMAVFERAQTRHEIAVSFGPTGPQGLVRQRVVVDGRGLQQVAKLLELVNVVAFFPEDLRIAKGGPEMRRRFFDRAVAGGRPSFVTASLAFHRALKARNVVLRSPQASKALVAAYDDALARHGATIHQARLEALAELEGEACKAFAALMPNASLQLAWQPGFTLDPAFGDGPAGLGEALRAMWRVHYPRDRARGMTLQGPHRADLICHVDGRDVRTHASQGQQRCVVLALKVAELVCAERRLHSAPILLLDDVSSELDRERLMALFGWVQTLGAQTWITTTGTVALPLLGATERLLVQGGKLRPMDS